MCSQHQRSAPCLMLSLYRAYSELRNPFHLSLPLHGASITLITLLHRNLIWVLKDPSPACMQLSSVSLHQRGRSCFGPKVHVLKAPLCRSKSSFWLAVAVLWLLGLLPTSLSGNRLWWWWCRQQRGWRSLTCGF